MAEGSEDVCPFEIVNNSDEQVLHHTWCTVQASISLKKKILFFFISSKTHTVNPSVTKFKTIEHGERLCAAYEDLDTVSSTSFCSVLHAFLGGYV